MWLSLLFFLIVTVLQQIRACMFIHMPVWSHPCVHIHHVVSLITHILWKWQADAEFTVTQISAYFFSCMCRLMHLHMVRCMYACTYVGRHTHLYMHTDHQTMVIYSLLNFIAQLIVYGHPNTCTCLCVFTPRLGMQMRFTLSLAHVWVWISVLSVLHLICGVHW